MVITFVGLDCFAREKIIRPSILLPSSNSSKSRLEPGSYYSIGTFGVIENAYKLQIRHSNLRPSIILLDKRNRIYYRVVVGPIIEADRNRFEKILDGSGLKDFWAVQIDGSEDIIANRTESNNRLQSKAMVRLKPAKIRDSKKKIVNREERNIRNSSMTKTKLSIHHKSKSIKKIKVRYKNKVLNLKYKPGDRFRDCDDCPEQVVLPAGDFVMGEKGGGIAKDALAVGVSIPASFSISRFEITFASWDACTADGGCAGYRPPDEGWGRGMRPVINVNWNDALNYVQWLTKKTGQTYRLPSEAEWEYAARAGTKSGYWWGKEAGINQAVCQDCGSIFDGERTAPVGSFSMNKFGLFDTAGNVWEWVSDCYDKQSYQFHKDYPEPFYRIAKFQKFDTCSRVLRGGGWDVMTLGIKPSFRFASSPSNRTNIYGFRVVREIK